MISAASQAGTLSGAGGGPGVSGAARREAHRRARPRAANPGQHHAWL